MKQKLDLGWKNLLCLMVSCRLQDTCIMSYHNNMTRHIWTVYLHLHLHYFRFENHLCFWSQSSILNVWSYVSFLRWLPKAVFSTKQQTTTSHAYRQGLEYGIFYCFATSFYLRNWVFWCLQKCTQFDVPNILWQIRNFMHHLLEGKQKNDSLQFTI